MRTHLFCLIIAATVVSGCTMLECGEGTVRQNGQCVPGDEVVVDCGPGFFYDQGLGLCRPAFDGAWGVCGPNTTPGVNDAGVPVCIGTGGDLGCTVEPVCTAPTLGTRITVCGRIYDIENYLPMLDSQNFLDVGIYNPIAFAGNPDIDPLRLIKPDKCGYFESVDVSFSQGLTAVGVNDAGELMMGATDGGTFRLTGVASTASGGQIVKLAVFVTRRTTEEAWTASSGQGTSLATQGVYVPIFVDTNGTPPALSPTALAINPDAVYPFAGAPTAGVTITPTSAVDDFYFTNSDQTLTTPTPGGLGDAGVTGPNGAGMLLGLQSLRQHSGSGPAGCVWSSADAAEVPGLVLVALRTGTCN